MSLHAPQALLTNTASRLRLSATLEINELAQKRLSQGQDITHLGFGEATFPVQRDVLRAHQQASDCTSYLPVAGLKELRQVRVTPPHMGFIFMILYYSLLLASKAVA
jgi:aspartate aminotransferase